MRTFAIHDILKRFAEGEFDSSDDKIGSLNGPMSRLCTEIESAIGADTQDEVADLNKIINDLNSLIALGSSNEGQPCPRCGGDYPE